MVEGILEEHKFKFVVWVLDVKPTHIVGHHLFKLLLIRDFLISSFTDVALRHEIPENDVSILKKFFVLDLFLEHFID